MWRGCGRLAEPLWHSACDAGILLRLGALVVQDVLDGALAVQKHGERRDEKLLEMRGCRDRGVHDHGLVSEEVVDSYTIGGMVGNILCNAIRHVALVAEVVLRHVVGELRLKEESVAAVAIPLDQVRQAMLSLQAICDHIVAVDDGGHLAGVLAVLREAAALDVVGPPEPGVVQDHVPGVDPEHHVCLRLRRLRRPAHARDDVGHDPGVRGVARVGVFGVAPVHEHLSGLRACFQEDACDSHAVHVADLNDGGAVRSHESCVPQSQQYLVLNIQLQRFA
mmetsp:Transcript_11231/g.27941  ORF Transcript_11231/g.27941 Transcript_11231/m.27941 type:complete len:279 (-) Transcript_11231:62-898(-)